MRFPGPESPHELLPVVPALAVSSDDLSDDGVLATAQLSGIFGAGGQDTSPHLSWSEAPAGTRSFAITCHDPDAPTGSGFWHWAVADLPPTATELPAGAGDAASSALPAAAVTLRNDAGLRAFLGAAPPPGHGPHRYIFTVFAVDVESIGVDPDASPAMLTFLLAAHTLARGTLTGTCERDA